MSGPIQEGKATSTDAELAREHIADLEGIRLGYWRRLVREGKGRDLTLVEAAAILGLSVRSVNRRIKLGQLRGYKDSTGRMLVVPFGGEQDLPPRETDGQQGEELTKLWEEFKLLRVQLDVAIRERAEIEAELVEMSTALESAQNELAALWRHLGAIKSAQHTVSDDATDNYGVSKIRDQISDVRNIARTRRKLWSLTG